MLQNNLAICSYHNESVIPQYCNNNTILCMKYQYCSTLVYSDIAMYIHISKNRSMVSLTEVEKDRSERFISPTLNKQVNGD